MQSISLVGNLTADPVLREAASGNKRATFSVAVNEGQGDDEKTHFVNVTAFGTLGENVAASLKRGQRVVLMGRLDTYKREVSVDGEQKNLTMVNFIASAVGPDLRWATAQVTKVVRDASSNGSGDSGASKGSDAAPAAAPAERPRAAAAPAADDDDF